MKSTKKCTSTKAASDKKTVSDHLTTLHQRLYRTLQPAFRNSEDKEREWYTNDVQMQTLVIRSMSAFLAAISPETLRTPLVKGSVADMVKAIGSILRSPNDTVLIMASEALLKLISILPSSLLQPHVGYLSFPLASLLTSRQSQVAIISAKSLNSILSKLSLRKENEMWQILGQHNVVSQVILNLRNFSEKDMTIEYFVEMTSLLSSVMQEWPHTRYPVWTDAKLRELVELFSDRPESSVRVAVLQLYSAIALCGYGAQKLLESGELLVNRIVHCMGKSQPQSVRILAFKAAGEIMACEDLCLKVLSISCKPVVESIISALNCSSNHDGKASKEDVCLMMEACRLALIAQWPGRHHGYLWKLGIHKSLINVLMYDVLDVHPQHELWTAEEIVRVAREGLNANFLLDLRPYVWEIIGSLSAQCEEDFRPSKDGTEIYIRLLITSACVSFLDSIGRERLLRQADREYGFRSIAAGKAVLMMMYSPCEYIAFHSRLILSEVLRLEGKKQLKHLLKDFNFVDSEVTSMPDEHQMLITMMGITCYSGLSQFYRYFVIIEGVKALLGFVRWLVHNEVHIEGVSLSSHLRSKSKVRSCCKMDVESWEGKGIHLLLALWSLAELINCNEAEGESIDVFAREETYRKELFIHDIQDISARTSSNGLKWYSAHLLSLFGIYGFPSKLGKKFSSLFCEQEYSDMYLVLRDEKYISVHKVVLLRCPSFLPPEKTSNSLREDQVMDKIQKTKREVTLSAHVDEQALLKVLEFIYSGCLNAEGELVKKLKVLAKHCDIQPLLHLLSKKRPKWAASVPTFDLTIALGPAGRDFSDVTLEAKPSEEDTGWTSNCCAYSLPHIHCHKAILMSSCNYVRALFQSGMQESRSQFLKIPISWEALSKWVIWVYSGEVPKPVSGCMWDNKDKEKKMDDLQPYIELCWLAEYWFIDNLRDECSQVVASFLDSPELSLKLIPFAVNFCQWEIVDLAAKRVAPIYGKLRYSGMLDLLDEGIVELIRLASVRLSHE